MIDNNMDHLEKAVTDLYNFRDFYFESNPIESAVNFSSELKNELDKVVGILQADEAVAVKENRAFYYYLLGKTYNVENDYNTKAEEFLSKAVKLNPNLIDAWNNLGDTYFKRGDYVEAKNCFLNALNKEKNKVSLRSLSVVCRKENVNNKDEQLNNVKEGLDYAQQALALDPNDGTSWYIMGNAYISAFFSIKQSSRILAQAMDAYDRAEDNKISKSNPDLFYNKAVALKFQEEYEKALQYFDKARLYDPQWTAIEQIQENLIRYLNEVHDLTNARGRIKKKKLQVLISSINIDKHLGPFGTLVEDEAKGDVKLKCIQFSELKAGMNEKCVILGAVVCSVQNEDLLPFTFCMVDTSNNCINVTVYNIAKGQGVIIGDIVAIAMPCLKEIDFSFNDKRFQFKSIRVSNPLMMAVNGKILPTTKLSTMQISTSSEINKS